MGDERIPVNMRGKEDVALIEDGRGAIQLRALVFDGPIVQETIRP
jgi:hypothetical protein